MTDSILVRAPAKLNLALSVGPPLDSGFHPICSWMVTVDLCDELTLTRLDDEHLSRYAILWHPESKRPTQIDWPVTSDLAVRAHRARESHVGRLLPEQVRLDKRIPVGGGLGIRAMWLSMCRVTGHSGSQYLPITRVRTGPRIAR